MPSLAIYLPYCPSCVKKLRLQATELGPARNAAQVHANVAGHAVHIVDSKSWTVIETLAGEQPLPLWDDAD